MVSFYTNLMQRNMTKGEALLRHARPNVTAEVYMQEIPASVRAAVESLDQKLSEVRAKPPQAIEPN